MERLERLLENDPSLMESLKGLLENDPSLMEVVRSWTNGTYSKIRRPPNAFMLFAKVHRKLLAKENPHLKNTLISKMLGNAWKEAPDKIKNKYHADSRSLTYLHAKMHPGYIYCPYEARKRKSEKIKKGIEAIRGVSGGSSEVVTKEKRRNKTRHSLTYPTDVKREGNPQEDERSDFNDTAAITEYVPNNTECFIQPDDDEIISNSENEPADLETNLGYHDSSSRRSGRNIYYTPSYITGESSSSFPVESTHSSRPEQRTNSVFSEPSTFTYYQQGLPFYHYRRHPLYSEMQGGSHEGPYSVPYYTPGHYGPSQDHPFDRPAIPCYRNSSFGSYPQSSLQAPGNAPVSSFGFYPQPSSQTPGNIPNSNYLINREILQPAQKYLASFDRLIPSTMQYLKREPVSDSPLNSTLNNEENNLGYKVWIPESDSGSESDRLVVDDESNIEQSVAKEHEIQDILDTRHSNDIFNPDCINSSEPLNIQMLIKTSLDAPLTY